MIKNLSLSLITVLVILFISCQSSKEKLKKEIKSSEEQLFSEKETTDVSISEAKVVKLISLYEEYVSKYDEDSLVPEYMFRCAELSKSQKLFDKSLQLWGKIVENYPAFKKAPHALFLQGFLLENDLLEIEKAKEKYIEFLEKYPDHELYNSVKFSLQHLGRSPEDIIKEFEAQNNVSSN